MSLLGDFPISLLNRLPCPVPDDQIGQVPELSLNPTARESYAKKEGVFFPPSVSSGSLAGRPT